jgi:Icc-related predicted phosphoesterase
MNARLRTFLGPASIGVAGVLVGLALTPPSSHRLGPAVVEVSGRLGAGSTTLQITPLGTVAADTHLGPLHFTAALRQVDIEALGNAVTSPEGRDALVERVEGQLGALVRGAVLRIALGVVFAAALLAAALFRQRRRSGAIAAATALVVISALLLLAGRTYDQDAFEDAHYSGSLARARQVVETLSEHSETLDEARSRYQIGARRVSDLLRLLAEPAIDLQAGAVALLHISDIHANPLGLEIVQELATQFDIAAVIDTGDLASSTLDTGEISSLTGAVDRALIDAIEDLDVPYVFVPGNHDSHRLRRALAEASNVTVLDATRTQVGPIEIFGWADPTYSTTPLPEADKAEERLEHSSEVALAVVRNDPDVLAVHDSRLAARSDGLVPLVVAGHSHTRGFEVRDETLFLTVGSTGATGLTSLTVEADRFYEAEILYFEGDSLVAIDYVTLRGLGEDFTLDRNTL